MNSLDCNTASATHLPSLGISRAHNDRSGGSTEIIEEGAEICSTFPQSPIKGNEVAEKLQPLGKKCNSFLKEVGK